MKKSVFIAAVLSAAIFTSCASKEAEDDEIYYEGDEGFSTEIEAPQMTENFLGDFDAIKLEETMVLVKNLGKLKVKQLKSTYLVPRKNTVEFTFHYGANIIGLIMNQKERTAIIDTANRFFEEYENKELRKHKVNKRTAYYNSTMPLYWGIASTNYGSRKNKFYLNYEIIEKRAYFVIHFIPTRNDSDKNGGSTDTITTMTPKVTLYLSPSQLHEFVDLLEQENLENLVKNYNKKAYTY